MHDIYCTRNIDRLIESWERHGCIWLGRDENWQTEILLRVFCACIVSMCIHLMKTNFLIFQIPDFGCQLFCLATSKHTRQHFQIKLFTQFIETLTGSARVGVFRWKVKGRGRGEFWRNFWLMKRRHVTNPLFSLVDIYEKFRKITQPSTCPLPFI